MLNFVSFEIKFEGMASIKDVLCESFSWGINANDEYHEVEDAITRVVYLKQLKLERFLDRSSIMILNGLKSRYKSIEYLILTVKKKMPRSDSRGVLLHDLVQYKFKNGEVVEVGINDKLGNDINSISENFSFKFERVEFSLNYKGHDSGGVRKYLFNSENAKSVGFGVDEEIGYAGLSDFVEKNNNMLFNDFGSKYDFEI